MKNFLSIEACSRAEIEELVESSISLKEARNRRDFSSKPLSDQCWGIIFSKASTRTRISFEVGIRELGGSAMFLSPRDLQLGRGEPIKDTARVMGRMLHGAVIRNDSQIEVEQFAELSDIPTINALTDQEHPCQIIADLLTVRETLGSWEGKKVVFLGDADCNVAHSWVWAAKHLGFELVLSGPPQICSPVDYLKGLDCSNVSFLEDPVAAVADANVLYTDVWVSMGMEDEEARREGAFTDYQINEKIINLADPNVMVMHCLPAYRDKEISESAFEANAGTIFSQAENRLHAQKAIMRDLAT